MTIKEKVLSVLILICLTVPVTVSFSGIKKGEHQSEEFEVIKGSLLDEPDNVSIYASVNRLRTMTVKENEPKLYFKIYIDGEDSAWRDERGWPDIYEGNDIWFEWPIGGRQISYNPEELVNIQIEVWQKNGLFNESSLVDGVFDISKGKSPFPAGKTINLFYDIKTGDWTGDDYLGDENGYGHCSGFEDGNENENDCEIWFDIYQRYEDWYEDRLTYWEKANKYNLNVSQQYIGVDFNGDGIPIEWEDKYGFDPFVESNISDEDSDDDGLSNIEEWKTSQWLSDPFSKDIFMEIDGMQPKHPRGKPYIFPKESQQLLCNAFARQNITMHIDDGNMASGGGDLIPFDESMNGRELMATRFKYFLNEDENNWKKGVFHYAIIGCQMEWRCPAGGRAFEIDSHFIGGQYVRNWAWSFYLQGSNYYKAFASVFMHELGHTLGLNNFEGIDNENSRFPWNEEFWEWGPYKSCMNYRYVYKLVDYSNGDDDDHDQDDWGIIDLARINRESW